MAQDMEADAEARWCAAEGQDPYWPNQRRCGPYRMAWGGHSYLCQSNCQQPLDACGCAWPEGWSSTSRTCRQTSAGNGEKQRFCERPIGDQETNNKLEKIAEASGYVSANTWERTHDWCGYNFYKPGWGSSWSVEIDVPGSRGVCGAMIQKGAAKFCVWGLHPIQNNNNVRHLLVGLLVSSRESVGMSPINHFLWFPLRGPLCSFPHSLLSLLSTSKVSPVALHSFLTSSAIRG
ncbi:unnamed protein product [Effrenium voratum]|nr:unnamed protein product [Effrenium voratum]